jgi:hypothetical protein
MYRRNLDIALAAVIAILGGLAAAKHMPMTVTVPLGVGLFLAPGYLWSRAILTQRLSGAERVMTSVGITLLLPIIGGFLLYALKVPLHRADWTGMLVVLTLAGVVAAAIQRLREPPAAQLQQRGQQGRPQQGRPQQRRGGAASAVNISFFVLAALVGLGAVAFSVKSAEAQKFPGYSAISMTQIVPGAQSFVGRSVNSPGNPQADGTKATTAHLRVDNQEGQPESYEVKLYEKKKLYKTWTFTLDSGGTWQMVIPYTLKYNMHANLYFASDLTKVIGSADNGS